MNLESAEQRVLAYLKQVSNPLVRLTTLLNYVREEEELAHLSENEFLDFLRNHELFRVVDPATFSEGLGDALSAAGLLNERAVILDTRMPTPGQVSELMQIQLAMLGEALNAAWKTAEESGDELKQERIKRLLQRTETLLKKVRPATD